MISSGKWFERKFRFDFPLSLYPGMVERLRGTPARLEEKVADLPSEVLTRRVNGGWSIQENGGHLLDLDVLHSQRVQEFIKGVHVLSAADLTNGRTQHANHNAISINAILRAFRTERSQIISVLENLDESVVSRTAMHPRLMQMINLVDLCYFFAEHDDHHLARMSELIKLSSNRS